MIRYFSDVARDLMTRLPLYHHLPGRPTTTSPTQTTPSWMPTTRESACHRVFASQSRVIACVAALVRHRLPVHHHSALWTACGHTQQRHACHRFSSCSAAFRLVPRLDLAHPTALMMRYHLQAQGGSVNGLQSAQHTNTESTTSRSTSWFQPLPRTVTEDPSS